MFDGKSLDGWKSNEEKPGCFTVTDDGVLKVSGGRAHLFYVGKDGKWFEYTIRVEGKRVIIKVDGKVTIDYTEPDNIGKDRPENMGGVFLTEGLSPSRDTIRKAPSICATSV